MTHLGRRCTWMVLGLVILGCHSITGVREAPPDAGKSRAFAAPLSRVLAAAREALTASQFQLREIVPEGDSAWALIATQGQSFASYGEIVRVRLVGRDSALTWAWVHTQKKMATNLFATGDWSPALFQQMEATLGLPQSASASP